MNAGLGSLTLLKSRLLPPQSAAQTDSDAAILRIGLGTVRWFERLCDRRFERTVDDTCVFRSDRTYVVVPRYPLESVAAVDQSLLGTGVWTSSDLPYLLFPESGLVDFGQALGTSDTQLRVTYTGGWWFDESEDNSGIQPIGATPLPDDLRFAWLEQAAFLFDRQSRLGIEKIVHGGTFTLEPTELLPHVRAILLAHRRHSLT
jgi:hypothetical protein